MTAITGTAGITMRPGELGIHFMDRFNMVAPDFYSSFGLDVHEESQGLGLFTFGSDHRWASLSDDKRKKLNNLSLAVFEEDFEPIKNRIEDAGIKLFDAPHGSDSNGIWFYDPLGVLNEVKAAQKTSPDEKTEFTLKSVPGSEMGFIQRSKASSVRPHRLAHLFVFTRSVPEAISFYSRTQGLRISDRSGDGISFMHDIHGSDHPLIAFAKSSARVCTIAVGTWAACLGGALFPPRQKTVGQLFRVFRRFRLGWRRLTARRFHLSLGAGYAGGHRPQLRVRS
ncbi:hypothetical protein AB9F29_11540 [Falsihalocynthiibacter sp. S25ZX9]|uniref:hypothetical protein n=1 Tax=Falsihalocynthiibacter sp. S25ZX9 TaxID=3240870 RepID=UPI00350F0F50